MGTSNLREGSAWIAGARIFSGRPDPTWPLTAEAAERALTLWDAAAVTAAPIPAAPPLGYRGAVLAAPDGRRWMAFGGIVEMRTDATVERRADPERLFERFLIAAAPEPLCERLMGLIG